MTCKWSMDSYACTYVIKFLVESTKQKSSSQNDFSKYAAAGSTCEDMNYGRGWH